MLVDKLKPVEGHWYDITYFGGYSGYETVREPIEWKLATHIVDDFSQGIRPAFRVAGHCRNCGYKSVARFAAGTVIPLYVFCVTCETYEFSAHGGLQDRDEVSEKESREATELRIAEMNVKEQEEYQQRLRDSP